MKLYELGELYQIGIRSLVATLLVYKTQPYILYQIGIRSLVATLEVMCVNISLLYQIGIRSLVATYHWRLY